MALSVDLTEVTYALSDAIDLVGQTTERHCKHVAYITRECGKQLNFDHEMLHDLFYAALLHDSGISSSVTHETHITELKWSDAAQSCIQGYKLLQGFGPFAELAEMVRHHHTPWQELLALPVTERTRWGANCLHLGDRVDALIIQHKDQELLRARGQIREIIASMSATEFAVELVDAFLAVSAPESFWLMLGSRHLERYMTKLLQQSRHKEVGIEGVRGIATLFARIIDAKSPYTADHSEGVAQLARALANKSGLPGDRCTLVEIAGLLHDLGKLGISDQIINKPGKLDETEYAIMEHHPFETYQLLNQIGAFSEIAVWAGLHHESLAGNGYPFHYSQAQVPVEARIVAVADVVQAMVQHRPYREVVPHDKIINTITSMARQGRLDGGLVGLFQAHQDELWEHALSGERRQALLAAM